MPEGLFHEGEIDVANDEMADERMLQHIMVNLVWVRMANPPATASLVELLTPTAAVALPLYVELHALHGLRLPRRTT